jgi:diacylglycerol kinase
MRQSFAHAMRGVRLLLRTERNFIIHALAAIAVVGLGWYVHLCQWEWVAVVLCIVNVMAIEAINTALEKLCDKVEPDHNPVIHDIKDIAAGAVLAVAAGAAIVGAIIFIPKFG